MHTIIHKYSSNKHFSVKSILKISKWVVTSCPCQWRGRRSGGPSDQRREAEEETKLWKVFKSNHKIIIVKRMKMNNFLTVYLKLNWIKFLATTNYQFLFDFLVAEIEIANSRFKAVSPLKYPDDVCNSLFHVILTSF